MPDQNQISPQDMNKLQSIAQRIQTGQSVSDEDMSFFENSPIDGNAKVLYKTLNKRNKGERLTSEEENILRDFEENQKHGELPISQESHENLNRFQFDRQKAAYEINHITDIHRRPQDLEQILLGNLDKENHLEKDRNGNIKIKDNVAVAITGDVGTDFFDNENHGLEAFLVKTIKSKAGWTPEEEELFESYYLDLMKQAGLDENMIEERDPSMMGENGPLQIFHAYLFGAADPHFLTQEQLKEFRKKRKVVQNLLKKGMRHHARKEYEQIKEIFEKYNFTPDKIAMVSGNHDVPEIMKEVLGDYLIMPGEVREVSGIKFGNVVDSANGNFTNGPDFNDIFGYAGLREELENVRYKSDPFVKLQNTLKEYGVEFDDRDLKKYMNVSLQRAAQGIGSGALGQYFKDKIEPVLRHHVANRIAKLKDNIPKEADIVLQHSMLDDPQRAGLEENVAHQLLSEHMPNTVVLHGHEHSPTPHRRDGITHINPGSVQAGNSAVHLLDENKKYSSSLFKGTDQNLQQTYRHMRYEEVPGQNSQRYQGH